MSMKVKKFEILKASGSNSLGNDKTIYGSLLMILVSRKRRLTLIAPSDGRVLEALLIPNVP